jgi:hypothetical protein
MHIVNHAQPDVTGQNGVGGLVAEFPGVAPVVAGQAGEPAQHRVERPLGRRGRQAHVHHRHPVMPGTGDRAITADLPLVEGPGKHQGDGGLAQPGAGVDHRGALNLVPVLPAGLRDVVQVLMHGAHLRGAQRADAGVPDRALLLVLQPGLPGQLADLGGGQQAGPLPGRRGNELVPPLPGGQRAGALSRPQRCAHTVSIASA